MPEIRKQLLGKILRPGQRPENVQFFTDAPEQLIQTFSDGDATPSVYTTEGYSIFKTANTTPTTISDFDDGRVGQIIEVLIKDANTTIDFTSSGLIGNGGVDWSPSSNDYMTCVYDGADWFCDVHSASTDTFLKNIVEDLTPQLGGDLDGNGKTFIDYAIESTSPSISSGAITFNFNNGNAFQVSLTENITSITISNPPTSGDYGEMIIKFVQDGTGSRTVSGWPSSVKWPGGTAPTITTTATTGTDIVALKTWNAGTTFYGDYSQDYS